MNKEQHEFLTEEDIEKVFKACIKMEFIRGTDVCAFWANWLNRRFAVFHKPGWKDTNIGYINNLLKEK